MSDRQPTRSPRRMKMKELEQATGVGRETIRYYIREELLPEPERPGRNVAWYDESHVARIALIKRLQQEHFLPLSVIKTVVAGDSDGPTDAEVRLLHDLEGRLHPHGPVRPAEKVTHLARRTGLSGKEIRELARLGVIEIVTRQGSSWVEGNSIAIVELWSKMRRAGFSDDLGFGPEVLSVYVQFVSWLTREELRIFTEHVSGHLGPDDSSQMADAGILYLGRIITLMRESALVRMTEEGDVRPAGQVNPPVRRTGSDG